MTEVAQKLTSIDFEGNPSMGAPRKNKVVLRYHEGKLLRLDLVFVAPNIVLLWNADLTKA